MALTISGGCGGRTSLYSNPAASSRRAAAGIAFLPLSSSPRTRHVVVASKKLSYGRSESKNSRNNTTTVNENDRKRTDEIGGENGDDDLTNEIDDDFEMPELPGLEKDFWEGEQWDTLGFIVQYLWAFGIVFALIACGLAVATYNEGATDFKNTPAYKESIGSQEALEEPEGSNAEVFESNPTEVAPSLE